MENRTANRTANQITDSMAHRETKVVKHESQEELFFACASFIILLVVATADVLVRTW